MARCTIAVSKAKIQKEKGMVRNPEVEPRGFLKVQPRDSFSCELRNSKLI